MFSSPLSQAFKISHMERTIAEPVCFFSPVTIKEVSKQSRRRRSLSLGGNIPLGMSGRITPSLQSTAGGEQVRMCAVHRDTLNVWKLVRECISHISADRDLGRALRALYLLRYHRNTKS